MLYDVFEDLVVGALGSILATFIIYTFSILYDFKSKSRIFYHIELAFNHIYQIENHHCYSEDYSIIVHSTETMHKIMFEIHENIYPFTLPLHRTTKKIIQTILYDITRRCELFLFSTTGYDGKQELEARLNKINKYFYTQTNEMDSCSVVRIELELIKQLFFYKSFYKVFRKKNKIPYELDISFLENLIEINSFKTGINDCLVKKQGITSKEYVKLIKKIKT